MGSQKADLGTGAGANGQGQQPPKSTRQLRPRRHAKARLLTLNDLDLRTQAAQKALQMRDALLAERGGSDRLSIMRKAMVATIAVITAMIEDQQTRWLAGQDIDATALMTLINARRREAELIGLDPQPLDITPPSLKDYLASKAADSQPSSPVSPIEEGVTDLPSTETPTSGRYRGLP
jgi:hypothetical protein